MHSILENLDKEKKAAANAKNKANFYLAANALLVIFNYTQKIDRAVTAYSTFTLHLKEVLFKLILFVFHITVPFFP